MFCASRLIACVRLVSRYSEISQHQPKYILKMHQEVKDLLSIIDGIVVGSYGARGLDPNFPYNNIDVLVAPDSNLEDIIARIGGEMHCLDGGGIEYVYLPAGTRPGIDVGVIITPGVFREDRIDIPVCAGYLDKTGKYTAVHIDEYAETTDERIHKYAARGIQFEHTRVSRDTNFYPELANARHRSGENITFIDLEITESFVDKYGDYMDDGTCFVRCRFTCRRPIPAHKAEYYNCVFVWTYIEEVPVFYGRCIGYVKILYDSRYWADSSAGTMLLVEHKNATALTRHASVVVDHETERNEILYDFLIGLPVLTDAHREWMRDVGPPKSAEKLIKLCMKSRDIYDKYAEHLYEQLSRTTTVMHSDAFVPLEWVWNLSHAIRLTVSDATRQHDTDSQIQFVTGYDDVDKLTKEFNPRILSNDLVSFIVVACPHLAHRFVEFPRRHVVRQGDRLILSE